MPIDLPIGWVIALNVAGWPLIQFGLAWLFTRMPSEWFHSAGAQAWERGGRFYERMLGVKLWKDWLPDGARWLPGGFPKGSLAVSSPEYFRRFISETWRGELCHWCAIGCAPIFFLWNPLWADVVMTSYALAVNLPCIVTQRYNRARFQRVLARTQR